MAKTVAMMQEDQTCLQIRRPEFSGPCFRIQSLALRGLLLWMVRTPVMPKCLNFTNLKILGRWWLWRQSFRISPNPNIKTGQLDLKTKNPQAAATIKLNDKRAVKNLKIQASRDEPPRVTISTCYQHLGRRKKWEATGQVMDSTTTEPQRSP